MFSKEQKMLFKYSSNKIIDNNIMTSTLHPKTKEKEYYNQLFESYINSKNKSSKDPTHNKLVEYMNDDLKIIFEKIIQNNNNVNNNITNNASNNISINNYLK